MKQLISFVFFLLTYSIVNSQPLQNTANLGNNTENIYTIKKLYLERVLHNPNEKNIGSADNDLERFNRWFNFVEPRCYPSGNLPHPDVILEASKKRGGILSKEQKSTSGSPTWSCLGPFNVPTGFNGIGRINCVVIDPLDTNTLYIGAACGGVWISHDNGSTWTSNTDNFPSLSIADIAVNPIHTDTLYAATGDCYGNVLYGAGIDNIFLGGLYSAGVMKSTDGGSTWNTTGLSYPQSSRDIILKLLIHPNNPDILIAATAYGIYRTSDAGDTWNLVFNTHAYSMVFKPNQPDTIYAVDTANVLASYDAGLTWSILYAGISVWGDRSTLAVSPIAPNCIWVMNDESRIYASYDNGSTFSYISTSPIFIFDCYYAQLFGVSPTNANHIVTGAQQFNHSLDSGYTWTSLDDTVHVDYHCIAFNILNGSTFYVGNDGGIWRTTNSGNSFVNLCNNMAISQIYRTSSSRQNPMLMICGLQDNSSYYNDGTSWLMANVPVIGDGMDCAIHPLNDSVQIAATQDATFYVSIDKGATFNSVYFDTSLIAYWTAPVVFNPSSPDTIYFGTTNVFASYDRGLTTTNITHTYPFPHGAVSLAISHSNHEVLYAADFSHILRTLDAGSTWTDVTGAIFSDSLPITHITVDYNNPLLIYATVSGYQSGKKVYSSTTGGTIWTNISVDLPNIPANCIVSDSSTPGALYVGTDIGVYYTDAAHTGWSLYGTGLPNVIIDGLDINYTNHKIRAATYGRGVWEIPLNHGALSTPEVTKIETKASLIPNPTKDSWSIVFTQKQTDFTVTLTDVLGHIILTRKNLDIIETGCLAPGVYNIQIKSGVEMYSMKAIKE